MLEIFLTDQVHLDADEELLDELADDDDDEELEDDAALGLNPS